MTFETKLLPKEKNQTLDVNAYQNKRSKYGLLILLDEVPILTISDHLLS